MTYISLQHMPLASAYLCEDCDCIGNCSQHCPACASSALLCLAGILNRAEAMEGAQAGRGFPAGRKGEALAA